MNSQAIIKREDQAVYERQGLDFRQYIDSLYESKWLIAFCILLFLLIGLLYVVLAEPVYSAGATIKIESSEDGERRSSLGQKFTIFGDINAINTELQIIQSRLVLDPVIEKYQLGVTAEPVFFPVVGKGIARLSKPRTRLKSITEKLVSNFPVLGRYAWSDEKIAVTQFDVPAGYIDTEFTVEVLDNSEFALTDETNELLLTGTLGTLHTFPDSVGDESFAINISWQNAKPGTRFALIRNSGFEAAKELRNGLRLSEIGDDSGVLNIELQNKSRAESVSLLNSIIDSYLDRDRQLKLVDVDRNLKFLQIRLPEVKLEVEQAEANLNQYRLERGSADLSLETRATLSRIATIEAELSALNLRKEELSSIFTDENRSVIELEAKISQLRRELGQLRGKVNALPETQSEILSLTRDVEVKTALYEALLTRTQELNIAEASATSDKIILERASAAIIPLSPSKAVILFVVTLLGANLGLFLSFLRNSFSSGVEDPLNIERQLGMPVCSTIPHSRTEKKLNLKRSRSRGLGTAGTLALQKSDDPAIESLRYLRTKVIQTTPQAKNNILLVTSCSPNVGKSFVSSNLAVLLARSGRKVALIDGDMRAGRLQKSFGLEKSPGLVELLQGDIALKDVIRSTDVDNLSLVPCGGYAETPSELLLDKRYRSLLLILAYQFDHIIIDSPPVLAAADAGIMSFSAANTLVVVKSRRNPMAEVAQCIKHLKQDAANILGIVLNDIKITRNSKSMGGYVYNYSREYQN